MSRLDDRLTRGLERAARPADPSGVFERIDRRRARRHALRRAHAAALAIVVVAGSVGGFALLTRVFSENGSRLGSIPGTQNGLIVYSEVANHGPEGARHLRVVESEGSRARQLTNGDGVTDTSPAVSPDGQTVAFVRTDGVPGDLLREGTIWSVSIDGTGLRQISPPGWVALDPAWSPDGTRIAFSGSDGERVGIFTITPEGTDIQPASVGGLPIQPRSPSWSPDGETIVFADATDIGQEQAPVRRPHWDIYAVATDGSSFGGITHSPNRSEENPVYSPDGRSIVFLDTTDAPLTTIKLMNDDGTGVRPVTDGTHDDTNPTWSPDGQYILFGRVANLPTVYTIRPDGSELTEVVAGGDDPAWQAVLSNVDSSPSPVPSPTPTAAGQVGPGLGFPICNVSSVTGTFGSAQTLGTAYVATKMGDGTGCPPVDGGFNVIAIDLDGDGVADTDYGPIECELECRAFAAPDLDGNGISELLVVQRGGTELGLGIFAMQNNWGPVGSAPVPVEVASPGDPEHGFVPGRPGRVFVGGDAGNAERLTCERVAGRIILVQSLGSSVPFDSPDAVWKIHEITLALESDGELHVIDTTDYEAPPGSSPFDGEVDLSAPVKCVA
jgi:Tol biopolymer transport system component